MGTKHAAGEPSMRTSKPRSSAPRTPGAPPTGNTSPPRGDTGDADTAVSDSGSGAADCTPPVLTCSVHSLPSQYRISAAPSGSAYQPAGVLDSLIGAPS